MQLIGERVNLRLLAQEDLSAFAHYRSLPEIARYQSWSEYTLEDANALFRNMGRRAFGAPGHWFQIAIIDNQTGQLTGDLALHFIDGRQTEVGFTLASDWQGQGIAAEALELMLSFLFDTMKQHRVISVTDCRNEGAVKLLERLNFRREAHFVENIFFKGEWGSEYQYAMLASEWASKRD
ncbi:GNAT family N-acetyltransferase [Shewanella sp. GXUN23E]|uniref:GNAT family N-acetyltransferase n=1 Tax=Shewanella sp. GXUN23E TaxID=3422498 RepID=UPI003D7D3323